MILIKWKANVKAASHGNCGSHARSWRHAFQNGLLKWRCHVWSTGDMPVGVIQGLVLVPGVDQVYWCIGSDQVYYWCAWCWCRPSGRNNAIGGGDTSTLCTRLVTRMMMMTSIRFSVFQDLNQTIRLNIGINYVRFWLGSPKEDKINKKEMVIVQDWNVIGVTNSSVSSIKMA